MITRRRVLLAVLALLLAGITVVVWKVADWPPPRLILKYGFPPTGGPTGRTKVIEGIEFVELKPGYFRMGSAFDAHPGDLLGRLCAAVGLPWGDQPEYWGDLPLHWVEFRHAFWIAKTEVTNAQYERFDPAYERCMDSKSDDGPAADLSWADAVRYCRWLSARTGLPVRLPSEAEWEYACRAGSEGEYSFGNDEAELAAYAWYEGNSDSVPHRVAQKMPNRWGLYDMHGNVAEWCEDICYPDYVDAPRDGSARLSPASTNGGITDRVHRGGCWLWSAYYCRSAHHPWDHNPSHTWCYGFRPVFTLPEDE